MPQFRDASVSYPNFLDWQQRSRSFEAMAAFRNDSFNLTGQGTPERLRGEMVSSTMFDVLGVRPIVGRTFTADEDRRGAAPVAILTSSFWKTRFAGDPSVVGRTITMNEKLYTVVAVIPSDDVIWRRVSVIVPIGQWTEPLFWDRATGMGMRVLGRLKSTSTARQAQSELDGIASQLSREYPHQNKDRGIYSVLLSEDTVGDIRMPLLTLLLAVGFVLLIACANVANLLLARSAVRRREFAIRCALGASRTRIVRQLLTEGLALAVCGGGVGLFVAALLNSVLAQQVSKQLPRAEQLHLDTTVLAFTASVSILASLIFSITPAVQSSRINQHETLKETGRGNTGRQGFQRVLVVAELALALVLTLSAGLMIRTIAQLWNVNPGFDPKQVLDLNVAGSQAVHGTPAAVRAGLSQSVDVIRGVPGVRAVSIMFGGTPLTGSDSELPYWVEGQPKPADQSQMDMALFYGVAPDYLEVMRLPLLRGRFLLNQDSENTPCSTVVDEEFQKKAFGGRDPIGQYINFEIVPMKCQIVGIVGHVKHWGLDTDRTSKVHSQVYLSYRQFPDQVMDLASTGSEFLVRTEGDPYSIVPALRRAITGINGRMVMYGEEAMTDNINDTLASRRFTRLLLGIFAGLALALAAVGIYGVVSYSVTQATHEIGVRMALGADARTVLAMVLRGAMELALIAIAIGAVGGFAASRALRQLLFGVSSTDPATFGAVALLLAAITALASYIPARRATKVDPTVALRYE
jgi:predicted permease